ncbi:MAG: ketopantoate reductase family protein, partial [Candidatus Aminicenantes bacterium]|nr:ketopantoate reductase family protein [Candidatus Aminicenantes bacterium]
IGAGPVGSIMAACLARNGEEVYLIDIREDLITAVEKKGITLTGAGKNFSARVKGTGLFAASLDRFHVDLIFIAVKSNYMEALLEEIKLFYRIGQKFLIIQNGIDNEDQAANKFGVENVMRFVINYAGMIAEPGIVKVSFFNPPNYIGVLTPKNETIAKELAEALSSAGLQTEYVPEIKKYEWKKTILNAALMPVCAATGLTMKEAMGLEETRFLCEQILAESIRVAKEVGFDYGENFFETALSYLAKAGHHKPSTSLDMEAGNPIEYIFQPIIDYGKRKRIPTPYLESLTKVMRSLEHKKREIKLQDLDHS